MKVKVSKNDYKRVLLTDILPYEVPILFSNDGFYKIFSEKKELPSVYLSGLKVKSFTIPYSYKIKKGISNSRTLGIIHPATQLRICDFYDKYEHLMVHMCTKSPFSLRYPNKIGSYFYEKNFLQNRINLKDGLVQFHNHGFDIQQTASSSHFSYRKYPFIYKFYESYEFHRLERKFSKLLKLDIAKCFSHIYTHSVSWAVKSKEFSKINRSDNSFEGRLDRLFQDANYGETNGIIIGPEFSRIFAEIILQRVDLNVESHLLKEPRINKDRSYSIRRYVDDYFIFANDDEVFKIVEFVLANELEKYKLYLNESKRQVLDRPFVTSATMAKNDIADIIDDMYNSLVFSEKIDKLTTLINLNPEMNLGPDIMKELYPLKGVWNKKLQADKFIKRLKIAIKKNEATFYLVSSYLISALKNKFFKVIRLLRLFDLIGNKEVVYKFFSIFNEVIFFVYSMDFRVRQTYIISQVVLEINSFANGQNADVREVIKKNTFDELFMCLKNMGDITERPVELSNLLICMNALGDKYKLNPNELKDALGLDECSIKKMEYFSICSSLYYIGNDPRFDDMKNSIISAIVEIVSVRNDLKKDAEMYMMFIDLMTCPYLTIKQKRKVYKIYVEKTTEKKRFINKEVDSDIEFWGSDTVFFNWLGDADLEHVLYKKELRTPYE
ncbi:antiviral reverse transcriptase Drt3b [Lonsdalea populi]|uniref:RNA-directed DNA polymerase n=1 Tax=Lonsdalea populi TaxID=1172565 RepID=A0A3N0UI17_9GAMM|nr:antiviral reverse transcriptase Drt3b [Lonsdalea populi]ROH80219.1 RNA-directed DNA polymerase [Lonsdalea populi]ROH81979.1 RNA-directed DNA polymerase [Lonsdalea populi]